MIDRSATDRMLAANRYLVLGTAGKDGRPWVTPVFFAPLDPDRVCWVSSPDSRHSCNIAQRAAVAITVFDDDYDITQFPPMAHGGFSLSKLSFCSYDTLEDGEVIAWNAVASRHQWVLPKTELAALHAMHRGYDRLP